SMSIIDVAPNHGPVGTAVTISGTGFGTTPSQNTVTFNGTAASVTSATSKPRPAFWSSVWPCSCPARELIRRVRRRP
ncbi:MAG: IPT/TIG domain-containing protein, partial [Candidatus Rokubacteria bacterium]|nr:IPT/TIG domain-containing protein [Candidatus Rokubacteria bacterium]